LNGADVDRSKIRLDEVKNTGERYVRGQPPVYVLSYVDKNGHVQTIPKQFYADPNRCGQADRGARGSVGQDPAAGCISTKTMADLEPRQLRGAVVAVPRRRQASQLTSPAD
jgi:hypothetical protein